MCCFLNTAVQDAYEAAAERASTSAANGLTEPLLPSSKKVPDEEEGVRKVSGWAPPVWWGEGVVSQGEEA